MIKDLEFERSPTTVISSLGKPVTMKCYLRGSGAEDEDPPDVLWLRDGHILRFTDTNQFQIYTGNNSWTVISTLRYAALCVALIFFFSPSQSDKDL